MTKILSKKKSSVTYTFRESFTLSGMQVYLFETSRKLSCTEKTLVMSEIIYKEYFAADYKYGVRLTTNTNGKVLVTFNARNEHDRSKFVDDLKEAILEVQIYTQP